MSPAHAVRASDERSVRARVRSAREHIHRTVRALRAASFARCIRQAEPGAVHARRPARCFMARWLLAWLHAMPTLCHLVLM